MALIWDYFKRIEDDASIAQCKECDKFLSLGSDKPKSQTTHGLKKHLEKCHKAIHAVYLKRSAEQDAEKNAKKLKLSSSAAASVMPNFVQPKIAAAIAGVTERKSLFPDDHPTVQNIDKCIMDLIIVDMLPYSVVEGEAFKRLNFTDPTGQRRYKPKSEKYYRTKLMPATYDKVAAHIKKLLLEADWISFTTDGWSNPTKSCSLLSFTAHFVHESVRRKIILSAMVLEDDHTGQYLASKIHEAIDTWGIGSKIHLGISDNAANITSAMRIAGITGVGCLAHTLQLVLNDALFTQTSVESLVKKGRKIVMHFRHSEQACRHLLDCQASLNIAQHKLLQDVETRWNSTYIMFERLVEQQKAVNLYAINRGGVETLTNTEWELAERVVVLLKPFYEATIEISHDDACISSVVPIIAMLNGKLRSLPQDRGLLQMKAALRDAMNRRFAHVKTTGHFIAATLLDPRFKDTFFEAGEKEAATAVIVDFLSLVERAVQPINAAAATGGAPITVASEVATRPTSTAEITATGSNTADFGLWDEFNIQPAAAAYVEDKTPLYVQELNAYLCNHWPFALEPTPSFYSIHFINW